MQNQKGLKLDLYLRKSRKDLEEEKRLLESTGENVDTLRRHRNQLLAIVKRENHQILEVHEELESGGEYISERPQAQRLLRRIENGDVEAVLVMDLDRLGRGDMLDQGLWDRAFRFSGAKIITPTTVYDPEDEGWELIWSVKSMISRQELKGITKRLQRGRHESVREGKSISKKPPYGYLRDENLRLYPDPDTAWVIKKIFDMARSGYGRQSICQELDRLDILPPNQSAEVNQQHKSKLWSPTTVTAIIKNEVYKGDLVWGKFKSKKKRMGKGYDRIRVPEEEWIVYENAHEAIVSEEVWEEANTAHSGRWRPSTTASNKLSNPLAGILKCELCGYTMLYQPRKNRPTDAIRCTKPTCKGKQKGATLQLVEQRILESIHHFVGEFEKEIVHQEKEESLLPLKEKALEKKRLEIAELQKQNDNLHDLLERGVYDIDMFIKRQGNIKERMNQLLESVKVLEADIQKETAQEKNIEDFIPKIKNVLEAYQEAVEVEQKNRLLKSILEKVTYLRKPDWKKPEHFRIQIYPKYDH